MSQQRRQQEQASEMPVSYPNTGAALTQRLEKIRAGIPQEQASQRQIAIQAATMLNQRPGKTAEISQVQVPQVPTYQTAVLPRLQMNQGNSQIQVPQVPSAYQSSTEVPQQLERNRGPSQAQVTQPFSNFQSSTGVSPHQLERERHHGISQEQPSGIPCILSPSSSSAYSSGLDRDQRTSHARDCSPAQSSSGLCCCGSCGLCSSLCSCGSSGLCSSLCSSASKILMALLGLVSVVWLGLSIAEIVIGSVYLAQCQDQRYIPIYLIVSGVTVAVMALLSLVAGLKPSKILYGILGLLALFWFAWLIAGSVWTFSLYPTHNNIRCSPVVYLFTFAILIIQWILIALALPMIIPKLCSFCSSCASCSSCSLCSRCFSCCSYMRKH